MAYEANDNIVALATPPGEGGIAIIRLSGPEVMDLAESFFLPCRPQDIRKKKGFTLTLGWIVDQDGQKIDEVLLGLMRGPHSYTGEDVVEINCHGGNLPARRCLERCLKAGLRLAEPGEFTRRAFLNGRLDLSQAEAVVDIIRSKSERGLKLALQQLEGKISQYIAQIEDNLIKVTAMIEASLDFPDEVGELDYQESRLLLLQVKKDLDKIIAGGKRNEIFREGINIAICGKPNVGKSSLLNSLVKKEKAIVTSIPGTTRDIVEEYLNLGGIPIKIMDTAGIRSTEDLVEKIGVEKSREAMVKADLVIFMLDVSTGLQEEDLEIYRSLDPNKTVVMVNKEDLEEKNIQQEDLDHYFQDMQLIRGSVIKNTGMEELEQTVREMVLAGASHTDGLEIMVNLRQMGALQRSRSLVESALTSLEKVPLDCLSVDIRGALESLGEISGKTLKEEVIERIFHDFCIGK